MRKNLSLEDLGDLLEQPLIAVLCTRRKNGEPLLSPVWHEWRGGAFWVMTSHDNAKAQHVRRDPRASLVIYEPNPPWRGVEVRGEAILTTEGAKETARRIATHYVGEFFGEAYAAEGGNDTLIRLEPAEVRAWDFKDDLER